MRGHFDLDPHPRIGQPTREHRGGRAHLAEVVAQHGPRRREINGVGKDVSDSDHIRERRVGFPERGDDVAERLLGLFDHALGDRHLLVVEARRAGDVDPIAVDDRPRVRALALEVRPRGDESPLRHRHKLPGRAVSGQVLFQAREYWPDYMSCILVVRQDLIDSRPDIVQLLVDGIARSGLWLDRGKPHREAAADFVGRYYFHQEPALLRWALTNPMDRVVYSPLAPRKGDFDMVRDLMIETGVLNKKIEFTEYTDTRFSDGAAIQAPWRYEAGIARAR